jgi:hypothetical protein
LRNFKKYTAPASRKEYYEKNKDKDVINERNRKYKDATNYKPTPGQKKEYNKQAYFSIFTKKRKMMDSHGKKLQYTAPQRKRENGVLNLQGCKDIGFIYLLEILQ